MRFKNELKINKSVCQKKLKKATSDNKWDSKELVIKNKCLLKREKLHSFQKMLDQTLFQQDNMKI